MCVSSLQRLGASAALVLLSIAPVSAQIQACGRYEGQWLPIATVSRSRMEVLLDGRKKQTWNMDCQVRPASEFGDGFVQIVEVSADLDPLRNASAKERTDPSATRFKFHANLLADRSLNDCYVLFTFVTQGSLGTHLVPVGRLRPDKREPIEVELREHVDAVGSVHVFSHGLELRTNQHPDKYDVHAFYAALTAAAGGVSAAELLKLEEHHASALSLDGRYLAHIREQNDRNVLIVYDVESMKLVSTTPVANADDDIEDLFWVSDHEIAYVSHGVGDARHRQGGLKLLDARTGAITQLRGEIESIVSQVADHPDVLMVYAYLRGEWPWTFKYNVHTGKGSDVDEPEAGQYMLDRQGNDRVHYRYDGDTRRYFVRVTPDAGWRDLDDIVKQPGLHFDFTGEHLLDRVAEVHAVAPDGNTLYISSRLDSDRYQLAAFSLVDGTIKRIIARHPRYDLTTIDGGISRLLFAKKSPQLIGLVYEAQKPQVVWLDANFAAVQNAMDAKFPDHANLPVDWSDDAGTFIYFSGSDQDPGSYYIFRPREGRLFAFLQLSDQLHGRTLAKMEPFEFTARDGQKIPAYVTRPAGPAHGPAPLLVDIHGGPMARDHWGFDASSQFFASRGYLVLKVNYRGSSGYGAAFQNAGLQARLDTVVLDDIADGVRDLIKRGEVDPSRIAVMGGSFGGWATYMSLIKYPDLYRAGIAIAAVSNWRKALHDDRWKFENKVGYTFWKSLLGRKNFAEDEKFIDPYVRATELKQPIFIIHGERDNVVHATEARLMLNALRKHNSDVQARSFPDASHTYWSYADRVVMLNETADFLDRHLAAAPAGGTPATP